MNLQRIAALVLAAAPAGLGARGASSQETPSEKGLTAAEFESIRSAVKPQPDEWKWSRVNWETDVWKARQRAAREGKPIYYWTPGAGGRYCGWI